MPDIFHWDSYSDQPKILKREDKKILRRGYFMDFLKLLATNIIYFPFFFFKYLLQKNNIQFSKKKRDFYGMCVNLEKGDVQHALIEELGVTSLNIRVFLNDIDNIDDYVRFAEKFGHDKEILITIVQDREHIEDLVLLQRDIEILFDKFKQLSSEYQVGNAINRIKWAFVSVEEYLHFYQTVQEVRDEKFPALKLVGSSAIDFEYHMIVRSLFNPYRIHYDIFSALLYVDRRGSPKNRQIGIFDLKQKINFLYTIVKSAEKSENRIYITETNWPLAGTSPYAPTSEKECVTETVYMQYMLEYFDIAQKTGKIEKVFWHQLIAPGYGLVDDRGDSIHKRDAFYAFKKMIEEGGS